NCPTKSPPPSSPPSELSPYTRSDYSSIEHIMPQNPGAPGKWQDQQSALGKRFKYVVDDIGNLTLLGIGANKAVQDIDLESKSAAYVLTCDGADILRRARPRNVWGENEILERGRDMVRFICERWQLPGQDDEDGDQFIDPDSVLSTNVKAPRQRRTS
ncbi:HNH endonuclease family protein, partial [Noviherbaspirillum sp. CPCC 100848]